VTETKNAEEILADVKAKQPEEGKKKNKKNKNK